MATDAGIERLVAPESPGAEGWDDFVQLVAVRNECVRLGERRDRENTAEFLFARWHEPGQTPPLWLVARDLGRIVGYGQYSINTPDLDPVGYPNVMVLPDHRGRGIGTALATQIEAIAAADARRTLIVEFASPPVSGPQLSAPDGSGEIPAGDPGVRFALAHGYSLGQVYRLSSCTLPLSAERLDALEAAARAKAGTEYRVHTWEGATPERWVDDLAALMTRMATDAPAGDIDWPEEPWDAQRIRDNEAMHAAAGTSRFVAAAEHIPTVRLVAFTDAEVRLGSPGSAQQQDTLVLIEHRGHSLGMLLKVANLRALQSAHPEQRAILTENASENAHMLAINNALGFETFVFTGVWQKSL